MSIVFNVSISEVSFSFTNLNSLSLSSAVRYTDTTEATWIKIPSRGYIVVDTFQGVKSIYRKKYSDTDRTYSCAAFTKRYFMKKYGVVITGLLKGGTPVVSRGHIVLTNSPRAGDLVFNNVHTHSAIVKSVNKDGSIILIEQNKKLNGMAAKNRKIILSKKNNGYEYKIYRYIK